MATGVWTCAQRTKCSASSWAGVGELLPNKVQACGGSGPFVPTPACLGRAGPEGSAEHGRGGLNLNTWVDGTLSSLLALLAWYIQEQVNPSFPLGLPMLPSVPAVQPAWGSAIPGAGNGVSEDGPGSCL